MTARDEVYDRPMAYEEDDGRVVYRASSLGSCPGALVRARLGVSGSLPGDVMQERFQEGHDWEARVLAAGLGVDWVQMQEPDHLRAFGTVVEAKSAGGGVQVETELAWSNKVIRCHPDAIVVRGSSLEQFVCEVKFLGEQMYREVTREGKWPVGYEWQKAVEMLSTGLPMLYVVGEKVVSEGADGKRVVELGEVWTEEIALEDVPFSLKDVKARVLEIEGYVARGEMPPCPQPYMYPCPYWDHHEAVGPEVLDDEVLKEWVGVWRLAHKAYETAAKDLDFARAAVLEQMHELRVEGGRCDGVDVAVISAQAKGNVAWKKAYDALVKETGKKVDEDLFRGEPRAEYVKIQEAKSS